MKAEYFFNRSAKKNMIQWTEKEFIRTHPTLHKTIIEAIDNSMKHDSIAFAEWLRNMDNGETHYHVDGSKSDSIGFSPYDCYRDDILTVGELYKRWKKLKPTVKWEDPK